MERVKRTRQLSEKVAYGESNGKGKEEGTLGGNILPGPKIAMPILNLVNSLQKAFKNLFKISVFDEF